MDKAHIRLVSGKLVNVFRLSPEDIAIEDIAHALSQLNRFGGHTKHPYSVAQHSVFVAHMALMTGPTLVYQALMHDAQEGVGCVDVPSPIKAHCRDYKAAEWRVRIQLAPIFRLWGDEGPQVRELDAIACEIEQSMLRGQPVTERSVPFFADAALYLGQMTPREAKALFLEWFYEWKPY